MPADLRVQHLQTLAYLLSRGARHAHVPVTTVELAGAIGKSQQTASSHLVQLEADGFVERRAARRGGSPVRITARGYAELERVSAMLRGEIESQPADIVLEGKLVSGMGEGAYYMSLEGYTRQFRGAVGYVPFPGTLNVRLAEPHHILAAERLGAARGGALVGGFSDGRRTYGWVRCFAASVNGLGGCHVVRLERTHHDPDIVEVISRVGIREAAGLRDGSPVSLRLPVDPAGLSPGAATAAAP